MLKEKREALRKALEAVKAIQAKTAGSTATMSPDDEEAFDKALAHAEALQKDVARLERVEELDKAAGEPAPENPRLMGSGGVADPDLVKKQHEAWNRFLSGHTLKEAEMQVLRGQQSDDPTSGGYLVGPQQFVAELLKDLDDEVFMRRLSRIFPVTGSGSLGVPTLDTDLSDPEWTGEITAAPEDSMTFGKRELNPRYLAKLVKVSRPLVRRSAMDVPGIVRQRLATKFGEAEENAFLNGNGNAKPLGVFVASDQGISTSRDVTTASSLTVAPDDFINAYYELKEGYRRNATWIICRDLLKGLRKIKDANNQYVWTPFDFSGKMLTGAEPGAILGRPYVTSEFVTGQTAGAWVAGQYPAIVGDFRYYWIAEVLSLEVQVLMELYATTNQIGYVARQEVDGMPVLENAFARIKVKA